jgi:hypothetical protein
VNVVESPFAALRLRTDAAKRYKRSDRATAVIWKMLLVAERRFPRLNAPHLLAKVYAGVRYVDGVEAPAGRRLMRKSTPHLLAEAPDSVSVTLSTKAG